MGAPVRDDAIRTIRCVAPATVSNDRVIGNVWRDRQLVDRLDETIIGLKRIDTVRHAFQRARGWISDQQWLRRRVDGGKDRGVRTRAEPIRPIQPAANRLPRCGVAMNITRWTSGR